MSRSKKRNPIQKDYSKFRTKFYKRLANKKVRRYIEKIDNGKFYRKIFQSYDIHDYKFAAWSKSDKWYSVLKRK